MVFLFDRFEEYIPTVTSDFFSNLRILRNRAKYHFSIVFSLNRPLEDLIEPSLFADYYEFVAGHTVYLALADDSLGNTRISYIEKVAGKKVDLHLLAKIQALTGGHGKLTKLAVEAVIAQKIKPDELESFLLTQKTVVGALTEIWLSLLPAEQTSLFAKNYDATQQSYLEHVGLLRDGELQMPMLGTYIATFATDAKSLEGKITYDERTNTITKGETVISDQLTFSEFRLLRYMLARPETIVERDDLISVVWEDVKSTAGITDQAVDQLVFRLRRKIEQDPNQPVHLLTVKGRGFRFHP